MFAHRAIAALLLLLAPLVSFAQSVQWYERTDEPVVTGNGISFPDPYPSDMVATEYGVYSTLSRCNDDTCVGLVTRHDAETGKRIWRRTIALQQHTTTEALAVDANGVYVAGQSFLPGGKRRSPDFISFVRRYSHNGDTQWTRKDWRNDIASHDLVTDDKGLYVIGRAPNFGSRAIIRHLNFDGELQWKTELPYGGGLWCNDQIIIGDDRLYAQDCTGDVAIYGTDGTSFGSAEISSRFSNSNLVYQDGFLYALREEELRKFTTDFDLLWTVTFDPKTNGLWLGRRISATDKGIMVDAAMAIPQGGSTPAPTGRAYVTFDAAGNIIDRLEMPGLLLGTYFQSEFDGSVYVHGVEFDRNDVEPVIVARISRSSLLPPAAQVLGSAPTLPPRVAVLQHNYGAGPVRAGIRDVAPGSIEYTTTFSEGLKPIAFEKVEDINGNGYEELVVVSNSPALAEVRDSLDGSLIKRIKLGKRFKPIAAVVGDASGAGATLGVLVRNVNNGQLLVRVHDLASGKVLNTIYFPAVLKPEAIEVVPGRAAGDPLRYAVLSRSSQPGAPHRIAIRGPNATQIDNFFIRPTNLPSTLALADSPAGPTLAVLLENTLGERPMVRQLKLNGGPSTRVRYVPQAVPVAMAVVPDTDGNGFPQLSVLVRNATGQVRLETRDGSGVGASQRTALNRNLDPRDVEFVGGVPGFSDATVGVLQMQNTDSKSRNVVSVPHVVIVNVEDGKTLFDLKFANLR